jgi:DNA mismatch repair protein MutL
MKINILKEHDARRIAAGEVIDRPASALRELLDNAIDSGASEISVYLEQGGIKSIEVADNGEGIARDDLERTILPHATSKIKSIHDLQSIYTLGFRGEALGSMAACSYLQIKSRVQGRDGYLMRASNSLVEAVEPGAMAPGTSVKISEIFYNLSARRRFLKSAGTETTECQKVFFEKALAYPAVTFKFYTDGTLKFHYGATTRIGRCQQIYKRELGIAPHYGENKYTLEFDGFELETVSATAGSWRGDRRYIHIYINGRRIIEYSLVQAVQYAFNTVMPAGQFPIAFIFIKVRADLADFNIHPAKREAKLHNLTAIHKAVVHALSRQIDLAKPEYLAERRTTEPPQIKPFSFEFDLAQFEAPATEQTREALQSHLEPVPAMKAPAEQTAAGSGAADTAGTERRSDGGPARPWRYLGQLMGVFLMVEWHETFYLIDHHAAHERILFDEFVSRPPAGQQLLSPLLIPVTSEERSLILLMKDEFKEIGVEIRAEDDRTLAITACPDGYDSNFWATVIKEGGSTVKKEFYATAACRKAIKEGEYIEESAAVELIRKTFALKHPYCPHGRPVWIEIEREQLYKWVKRIV